MTRNTILVLAGVAIVGVASLVLVIAGAATLLRSEISSLPGDEEPAAADDSRRIERPGFTLAYPGNWAIDTADEDFDPDAHFSIDSPGSSFVMFFVNDEAQDPAVQLAAQREAFESVSDDVEWTTRNTWGAFEGLGAEMSGTMLGMAESNRVFTWSDESRSFTVVESSFDEDREMTEPGFDLIRRTFAWK